MPFIGNKPTPVPLTSADLGDGIVTSAKIANGTIVGDDINSTFDLTGKTVTGAGGGKVLQVVQSILTAVNVSTSSTSFVSSGLSVNITPSSTSNKVLIYVMTDSDTNASGRQIYLTIFRDGTTNLGNASGGMTNMYGDSSRFIALATLVHLDAPSSISSLSYELYFRSNSATSVKLGGQSVNHSIVCMEIEG